MWNLVHDILSPILDTLLPTVHEHDEYVNDTTMGNHQRSIFRHNTNFEVLNNCVKTTPMNPNATLDDYKNYYRAALMPPKLGKPKIRIISQSREIWDSDISTSERFLCDDAESEEFGQPPIKGIHWATTEPREPCTAAGNECDHTANGGICTINRGESGDAPCDTNEHDQCFCKVAHCTETGDECEQYGMKCFKKGSIDACDSIKEKQCVCKKPEHAYKDKVKDAEHNDAEAGAQDEVKDVGKNDAKAGAHDDSLDSKDGKKKEDKKAKRPNISFTTANAGYHIKLKEIDPHSMKTIGPSYWDEIFACERPKGGDKLQMGKEACKLIPGKQLTTMKSAPGYKQFQKICIAPYDGFPHYYDFEIQTLNKPRWKFDEYLKGNFEGFHGVRKPMAHMIFKIQRYPLIASSTKEIGGETTVVGPSHPMSEHRYQPFDTETCGLINNKTPEELYPDPTPDEWGGVHPLAHAGHGGLKYGSRYERFLNDQEDGTVAEHGGNETKLAPQYFAYNADGKSRVINTSQWLHHGMPRMAPSVEWHDMEAYPKMTLGHKPGWQNVHPSMDAQGYKDFAKKSPAEVKVPGESFS